ncbi:unnamed protein product [Diabrotica balteata]|uniref:Uncharacterized protein n=1 Tax=Diabrotica balteata TaxID=107213 RepID=A0A9N9XAK5_DIABA|nr:unnamed protein product [Diabrotica balteata]
MYGVSKFKIKCITHKYLVVGHTQNQSDSIHSTIEKQVTRSLKSGPIFVPDQFSTLIQLAKKKGNPLKVKEVTHEQFISVKQHSADFGNFTKSSKGEQTLQVDVREFKPRKMTRQSGTEHVRPDNVLPPLQRAYSSKLPLNENKRNYLKFYTEGIYSKVL